MKTIALGLLIAGFLGCAATGTRSEPAANIQDDFFAQTKLIMSDEEIEIYRHLADADARAGFIADFWKKRNPSSASEENEFKREFYDRVAVANRWFHERGQAENGWDTERGHILIALGPPDQREQMPMLNNPAVKAAEIWLYYDYGLRLEFLDRVGGGKLRLEIWPLELLNALDQVKARGGGGSEKNYFRFKANANASGLLIEIPVKHVLVEERGNAIHAAFAVSVDVYCDFVKIERLVMTREFAEGRGTFMKRKTLAIDVPYVYRQPGKYLLDVVVEEKATQKRFRASAKFKQTGGK